MILGINHIGGIIIAQLSDGKTAETLVDEYPYLSLDDIFEALKYATKYDFYL